jgi:hypothetical protein
MLGGAPHGGTQSTVGPSLRPAPGVLRREFESSRGFSPHFGEIGADLLDPVFVEAVQPPRTIGRVHDQPCFLEEAEVARDGGAADRKLVRQLLDRPRADAQKLDDSPSIGVAEGLERIAREFVGQLSDGNRIVTVAGGLRKETV